MPAFLVILVVAVPLIELVVVLQVGQEIGVAWTIVALVSTSILGAALLRHEGRRAWRAFRDALAEERWPGDEVTQGAFVVIGGTLLLAPGFVTDALGLLLLLPLTRTGLSRLLRARVTPGPAGFFGARRRTSTSQRDGARPDVLDVEVVEIERESRYERDADDDGPSGEVGPGGGR